MWFAAVHAKKDVYLLNACQYFSYALLRNILINYNKFVTVSQKSAFFTNKNNVILFL